MILLKHYLSFFLNTLCFYSIVNKFNTFPFILMYHRIVSDIGDACNIQPGMLTLAETFEKHLKYLNSNYHVISLGDLFIRLTTGQDLKKSCAITFDDGWFDNYSQAFPLLKRYQTPASIFLPTNFIGTDRIFWPEELIFYLKQLPLLPLLHELSLLNMLYKSLGVKEATSNVIFYDAAISMLKTWLPREREDLLSELRCHKHFVRPEKRMLMNWQEAKEMQDSGLITFGSHTANHVMLDQVSLEEAEMEILQSQNTIETNLGITPELFAYPNGNFNADVKHLLWKIGYKLAVTTRKGLVHKDCDMFEVPRIGVHQDISSTIPLFLSRIYLKGF